MKKIIFIIFTILLIPFITVLLFYIFSHKSILSLNTEVFILWIISFILVFLPQFIIDLLNCFLKIKQIKLLIFIELVLTTVMAVIITALFSFSMYDKPTNLINYGIKYFNVYIPVILTSLIYRVIKIISINK